MEQFVQRFIQKYNITQQEADMLLAESVPVEFSRSEKIVNEGEINSDLYIVSHGVWRAYRLKDGIEMSMWFAIEGSLAFSVTGYAGEQASKLFIESLNRSRAHPPPSPPTASASCFPNRKNGPIWVAASSNSTLCMPRRNGMIYGPSQQKNVIYAC